MTPRGTIRLLDDILAAIDRVERYREARAAAPEDLLADAIRRRLAVIGEAAARLAPEIRGRAPDVPWGDIIGMRNRVVHAYDEIDWEIVEDVVTNDLGPLGARVRDLRAALEPADPAGQSP